LARQAPIANTAWNFGRAHCLLDLFFIVLSTAIKGAAVDRDTLRLLYWQAPTIINPHLSVGTKDLSASRIVMSPSATQFNQGYFK
jgi:hypothetical protein